MDQGLTWWSGALRACAAGGVVQYNINNFCIALEEVGMSLVHLDEFQQKVQLPKTHTPS